jgi:hypothetical protein
MCKGKFERTKDGDIQGLHEMGRMRWKEDEFDTILNAIANEVC